MGTTGLPVGLHKKHMQQVLQYLKNHKLSLGILAVFTPSGVNIKRIINLEKKN